MSVYGETPHILIIPHPASGHFIPILDFTHQLLIRSLTITIVVSPVELPLLDPLLNSHPSLHPLLLSPPPPPKDSVHTMFASLRAIAELRQPLLQWFQSHPSPPIAILSDFFLGWTHQLASDLGVRRIVFWPNNALSAAVFQFSWRDLHLLRSGESDDNLISFPEMPNSPSYPRWQLTHLSRHYKDGDPDSEFFRKGFLDNMLSWGLVFNSFTELDGVYKDYLKKSLGHDRVWAVGPLLPNKDGPIDSSIIRGGSSVVPPHQVMTWLDKKSNGSVVYVCFGSRGMITGKQMEALAAAIECSKVHFILCVKASDSGIIPIGFEDRVGERGFIIRGWVPQVAILRHRAVGAFVTHCGWNSVLEGVAAGVTLLMWPMGADQFSNTKLLVDQLGVAVRVCDGGPDSIPDLTELTRLLSESVSITGSERLGVKKLRDAASEAVNGGNSTQDLDLFVKQLSEL